MDALLRDAPEGPLLLLGNEAIVRGALEAGVVFACGYPGTPSSEITDTFARIAAARGIVFEYAVNEKVALEVAFAASLAGGRSIVAMKHLGLMVAGDPLSTIPYMGTPGGMVIVSAGDPSCRTSPNEQDQRQLARMLHIPVLDPSTPQEALDMTRFAFELSEKARLPVLLRPTTWVCHTRATVRAGALRDPVVRGFRRDPARLVPIPVHARKLRLEIDERLETARKLLLESGFLRREGEGRVGLAASGVPAALCAELLEELRGDSDPAVAEAARGVVLLALGAAFPLPEAWVVASLRGLDTLLVVEDLSPHLEDALRALVSLHGLGTRVLGKRTGHLSGPFEVEPARLRAAVLGMLGRGAGRREDRDESRDKEERDRKEKEKEAGRPPGAAAGGGTPAPSVEPAAAVTTPAPAASPRPPVLCPGCPHRSAFFAARAVFGADTLTFNDIGCYTLGFGPPLQTADALLCMGAGFTLASGVARTTGERTVGFMGDSTFFHSGMPALLDAIQSRANMVAVILDNRVTAMTGFQESPGIETEAGRIERRVDLEAVVRALGARHVETFDPQDLTAAVDAFRRAKEQPEVSVLIASRTCPVFERKVAGPPPPALPYTVDPDRCQHCGLEAAGMRCREETHEGFERAMCRARSLETAGEGIARPDVAPCTQVCPLGLCVQGYAAHIAAGEYREALDRILARLPLPASVCRVCHRPCEAVCVRADQDEAVAINDLKRFVVDWADREDPAPILPRVEPEHGRRAAIVGAGPSGLAAAHELRVRGWSVTLFDEEAEPGGLLRYGIPRYRLPLDAVERDVRRVLDLGVRFEGSRRLGRDLDMDELARSHDAVYLAVGASRSVPLGLPGEGPPVVDARAFLRRTREPGGTDASGRVLVVGGGDAAIDAARSALRCGAGSVQIVCLESRETMPAIPGEVEQARREGVVIRTGRIALRRVPAGVVLARVTPRRAPARTAEDYTIIEGTEETAPADLVIAAIGQVPDRKALGGGERAGDRGAGDGGDRDVVGGSDRGAGGAALAWSGGRLAVDPGTGRTSRATIYAGGDLVDERGSVTGAIAAGLRAAWAIDRDARGAEAANHRMPPAPVPAVPPESRQGVRRVDGSSRAMPPEREVWARRRRFDEVAGTLSEEDARAEASRCMICGTCGNCRSCLDLFGCPAFRLEGGRVVIDVDLCTGCGVCAAFCPNDAIAPREAGHA